jgi:transposase
MESVNVGENLLLLVGRIVVSLVEIGATQILVAIGGAETSAACPVCQNVSSGVHSRYSRTIRDLPWRGTPVVLQWCVRRFFCSQLDCPRQIFAEQLPKLAKRRGRTSIAFDQSLVDLGLECGGEAGRRLGKRQGLPTSGDTILRRLRALPLDDQACRELVERAQPRCIGIDDFAFCKGQTYGTVIVDHETGKVVDMLPDRSSESTAAWLQEHEGVEVVTRDRSSLYAGGISVGRPEAVQVADRFHLQLNLRESLVKMLDRVRGQLLEASHAVAGRAAIAARVSETASPAATAETPSLTPPLAPIAPPVSAITPIAPLVPAPGSPVPAAIVVVGSPVIRERALSKVEQLVAQRRQQRKDRYQQIVELAKQGVGIPEIAQQMGVTPPAIKRILGVEAYPEQSKHRTAGTVSRALDPFVRRLREMWDAGTHNSMELFRRIKSEGFCGSEHMVSRHVVPWRQGVVESVAAAAPLVRISCQRLSWLLLKDDIVRTPAEQKVIEQLRGDCETVRVAAEMAREFGPIFKERKVERLLGWIARAQAGVVAELKSFADGLLNDWPAVKAAVELPWSNGRAEGHVNRIKLIKRKMYGRGKFALLRIRVMATGP